MKTSILLFTFLCLTDLHAETLPNDWYQLPENASSKEMSLLGSKDKDESANLDTILKANSQALENSQFQFPASDAASNRPADWVPWRFVSYIMDIGVTAKGLIGTIGFKGSPSISVYWRRKEVLENNSPITTTDMSPLSLALSDDMNDIGVDKAIEPLIQTVMASGRINDEVALRENLKQSVRQITAWSSASTIPALSQWQVSRLRFDLSVDASSKVSFIATLGAAVRIRVEWFKTEKLKSAKGDLNTLTREQKVGLQELLSDMAEDLAVLSENESLIRGFRTKEFRVGVGLSTPSKVGLVTGSIGALFHVYFSRKTGAFTPIISQYSTRPLLAIGQSPQQLEYAKKHGIRFAANSSGNGEVIYKIDRDAHRKGLAKAVRMGQRFADAANTAETRSWFVQTIKLALDLSITGDESLANLTSTVASEMNLEKLTSN